MNHVQTSEVSEDLGSLHALRLVGVHLDVIDDLQIGAQGAEGFLGELLVVITRHRARDDERLFDALDAHVPQGRMGVLQGSRRLRYHIE